MDNPGKCLSVSGVTNAGDVILADCDPFDSNQLFDQSLLVKCFFVSFRTGHSYILVHFQNFNTNPGLLKLLGTNKCLTVSSNNHVQQVDCDITNVNDLWQVVLGTLVRER